MSTTAEIDAAEVAAELEAGDATAEPEVETPVEETKATEQQPRRLFQYAEFIHVGEGALECAGTDEEPGDGRTGRCSNPEHFHAWLRLPNQFQHETCRDKALAAKARRMRQCRDESTDIYEIIEGDMAAILRSGDKEAVVDDLVGQDFLQAHVEATKEVQERDEFKTIEDDLERFRVLGETDPDERPADEFVELQNHISAFHDTIDAERDKEVEPLKQSLLDKDLSDLVDMVREARIDTEGKVVFMAEYKKWAWLVATLVPRPEGKTPVNRVYGDINALMAADQEVLAALDTTYTALESRYQDAAGNS